MFSGNNMPRSCSAGVFNRCLTVRTSASLGIFMVCLKTTMIPFAEKFVATITLLLQPARSRQKPFPAKRLGGILPAARPQKSQRHPRQQGGRRSDSCREDTGSGGEWLSSPLACASFANGRTQPTRQRGREKRRQPGFLDPTSPLSLLPSERVTDPSSPRACTRSQNSEQKSATEARVIQ